MNLFVRIFLRHFTNPVVSFIQMESPIASYLVEEVLKDCAAIVKPYFSDALKSMSFEPADYAQTIALLSNEMPKGKEMVRCIHYYSVSSMQFCSV